MRKSSKPAAVKAAKAPKPAAIVSSVPVAVAAPAVAAVAKPAAGDVRAERAMLTATARAYCARLYNGPSLAVHTVKPATLNECIAVITTPRHRCGARGALPRDESLLMLCASELAADGSFDPSTHRIPADIGVLSRLASIGYIAIAASTGMPFITERGAERVRLVAKRA